MSTKQKKKNSATTLSQTTKSLSPGNLIGKGIEKMANSKSLSVTYPLAKKVIRGNLPITNAVERLEKPALLLQFIQDLHKYASSKNKLPQLDTYLEAIPFPLGDPAFLKIALETLQFCQNAETKDRMLQQLSHAALQQLLTQQKPVAALSAQLAVMCLETANIPLAAALLQKGADRATFIEQLNIAQRAPDSVILKLLDAHQTEQVRSLLPHLHNKTQFAINLLASRPEKEETLAILQLLVQLGADAAVVSAACVSRGHYLPWVAQLAANKTNNSGLLLAVSLLCQQEHIANILYNNDPSLLKQAADSYLACETNRLRIIEEFAKPTKNAALTALCQLDNINLSNTLFIARSNTPNFKQYLELYKALAPYIFKNKIAFYKNPAYCKPNDINDQVLTALLTQDGEWTSFETAMSLIGAQKETISFATIHNLLVDNKIEERFTRRVISDALQTLRRFEVQDFQKILSDQSGDIDKYVLKGCIQCIIGLSTAAQNNMMLRETLRQNFYFSSQDIGQLAVFTLLTGDATSTAQLLQKRADYQAFYDCLQQTKWSCGSAIRKLIKAGYFKTAGLLYWCKIRHFLGLGNTAAVHNQSATTEPAITLPSTQAVVSKLECATHSSQATLDQDINKLATQSNTPAPMKNAAKLTFFDTKNPQQATCLDNMLTQAFSKGL